MSPRTILVAVDFSAAAELATQIAGILAQPAGAKLIVLHVEPGLPTSRLGSAYAAIPEPGIGALAQRLAAVRPPQSNVEVEHRLEAGDPASAILNVAAETKAELIVLGGHTRGKLAWHLGSVTQGVAQKASCPVLVCNLPAVVSTAVPEQASNCGEQKMQLQSI
jgi:nucleotide-binding universal stress UspA family protein